jgi:hypothetical protein
MSASLISSLAGVGQSIVAGASGASGATLPTLLEMEALADIAGNWLWTANIYGVPGLPAFNNLLVESVNAPFEGFTADPRFRGGFTYNFPKFTNITPINLTLHELQTYIVTNYFMAWKNKIVDPGNQQASTAGNYALPADYYGNMIVTLFNTMGIPALEITYTGVWPERVNDLSLVTQGSGGLQVGVNLSVNRGNITYASATFLDSPLAQLVTGNPGATLRSLGALGKASLINAGGNALGRAFAAL